MTLGALFLGIVGIAFIAEGGFPEDVPWWGYLLMGGLVTLGVILLAIGLFASRKAAEKYANDSSTHAASLIVMALAAPLYWLLKAIEKRIVRARD